MIIKLKQPIDWTVYKRPGGTVRALRLAEDVMLETGTGWIQGRKGQWLLECGPNMRCVMDNETFQHYHAEEPKRR